VLIIFIIYSFLGFSFLSFTWLYFFSIIWINGISFLFSPWYNFICNHPYTAHKKKANSGWSVKPGSSWPKQADFKLKVQTLTTCHYMWAIFTEWVTEYESECVRQMDAFSAHLHTREDQSRMGLTTWLPEEKKQKKQTKKNNENKCSSHVPLLLYNKRQVVTMVTV